MNRNQSGSRRIVLILGFGVLVIGLACLCNGLTLPSMTSTPVPSPLPPEAPSEIPSQPSVPSAPSTTEPSKTGPWVLISDDNGLWTVNQDGSGLNQVWRGNFWQRNLKHSIQPGGNLVVLLTSSEDTYHHLALNLISIPDGEVRKITDLTSAQTEPGADAMPGDTPIEAVRAISDTVSYAWSPDGTKLAFIGVMDGPTAEVYLYDVPSGTIKRVSHDEVEDFSPSWSPDGKYILYFGADSFGTGAGYAMRGAWSAKGDGTNVTMLYETASGGEELVGWRDQATAVLDSWDPVCGPHALRLRNLENHKETMLQENCISAAATGTWNGTDPSPVMFSTSDGLFFLPGGNNQVMKLSGDSVEALRWDDPGYMFVAKFLDGSMRTYYSSDASQTYDAPFTFQSAWDVETSMFGLIWAWTDNENQNPGVWITGPGMDIGKIFDNSSSLPLWNDADNSLLFFSQSEMGTDIFRATFPTYRDATGVSHLDGTVQDATWIGKP